LITIEKTGGFMFFLFTAKNFSEQYPFTVVVSYSKEFNWADISIRTMTFFIHKNVFI